jgi:hypothetical protein
MWVFTEIGFFSATRYLEADDPTIQVRARAREDLENLIRGHLTCAPEILEWEGRDYPYRILISQHEWASALSQLAGLTDYSNFKDRVKKRQGPLRASWYMRVWEAMYDLEQKLIPKRKKATEEIEAFPFGKDPEWWHRLGPQAK